ncbi:MAG TPA: hypothetical protein VLZ74_06800 [Methylocella sp.]|nr:hypothetical protein [Methylocella sp.]
MRLICNNGHSSQRDSKFKVSQQARRHGHVTPTADLVSSSQAYQAIKDPSQRNFPREHRRCPDQSQYRISRAAKAQSALPYTAADEIFLIQRWPGKV